MHTLFGMGTEILPCDAVILGEPQEEFTAWRVEITICAVFLGGPQKEILLRSIVTQRYKKGKSRRNVQDIVYIESQSRDVVVVITLEIV